MRSLPRPTLALAVVACLLLFPLPEAAGPVEQAASPVSPSYPNTSWAMGVVVPEGASLQGGESARWETVSNVTASVALPAIGATDGAVYAILSVMTSDGTVLQAAAGATPSRSGWLGFGWSVQGARSGTPSYRWILNASGPSMSPLSKVSISIFHGQEGWALRIVDLDTGTSVAGSFPAGLASSLMVGDQEVFALESYTRTQEVFRGMGNLTLASVSLDGVKVAGGCYVYDQWDMVHNPLFVVGSSGSSPPSFIYLGETPAGSFFWEYSVVWGPSGGPLVGIAEVIVVGALLGSVAAAAAGFVLGRKTARRERTGRPSPTAAS